METIKQIPEVRSKRGVDWQSTKDFGGSETILYDTYSGRFMSLCICSNHRMCNTRSEP